MSGVDPVGDLPSRRLLGAMLPEPLDDTPLFLRKHLRPLLTQALIYAPEIAIDDIALRLRLTWAASDWGNPASVLVDVISSSEVSTAEYLDFIQLVLRDYHRRESADSEIADGIEYVLKLAGSLFAVSPDGLSIVHCNDATATVAALDAVSPADEASTVLSEAWSEAFSREPNAQDAWGSSIRAVEAVLIPILWPDPQKRGKQTLTTAIRRISDAPDKWKINHPKITIDTMSAMLRSLAYEPRRHGADSAEPATVGDAAACVHLSVTLVSWLRAGLLKPA